MNPRDWHDAMNGSPLAHWATYYGYRLIVRPLAAVVLLFAAYWLLMVLIRLS